VALVAAVVVAAVDLDAVEAVVVDAVDEAAADGDGVEAVPMKMSGCQ